MLLIWPMSRTVFDAVNDIISRVFEFELEGIVVVLDGTDVVDVVVEVVGIVVAIVVDITVVGDVEVVPVDVVV